MDRIKALIINRLLKNNSRPCAEFTGRFGTKESSAHPSRSDHQCLSWLAIGVRTTDRVVLQDKLPKMMHIQRNNNRLQRFEAVMHLTYIFLNL